MNIAKTFAIVSVIALAGTGFVLWNHQKNVSGPIMENEVVAAEGYEPRKEKIVFDKLSEVTVSSSEEVNNIIPITASFDLHFDKDVSTEYVENTFSLKPYKDVDVIEMNPRYYKLTVVNELQDDQIYNVIEQTTEGTKKWAFQTEKIFGIEYTYPGNGEFLTETGVPEIRFNSKLADNLKLKDYIIIEPNIKGEWESSYTYNYRFEHSEHFTPNTTYKITVKKGLMDANGNVLKEDHAFHFSISNEEDINGNLILLNRYHPGDKIDLSLSLSMNMNKSLSVKKAQMKIIDLGSKEEFVKAISHVNDLGKLKDYEAEKEFKAIFTKDMKEDITKIYQEEKSKNRYYYYDEMPINANLSIDKEGYYLAVLNLNSTLSAALFEVNEASATCSTLAGDNFMILYKGKEGKNNCVDVYVNSEKLGTTSEEGLLYVENFRRIIKNLNKEVNYIEFKNGSTPFICDISNQVNSEYTGENGLTSVKRFHNGYLYVDRNFYKVGETIHFWGYAKNRKIDIKDATIKIVSNYDDTLAEIPVKLTDVGTFEGEFEISNVNEESYITLTLLIGEDTIASRHVEVKNYELKQYQIEVKSESTKYLDGDTATINISATTYDGTPLNDLTFSYEINNQYYDNNGAQNQKGSIKTDASGNGIIQVPLKLNQKSNLLPETIRVTILNSYIDGEQENVYFTVYPYKHSAEGSVKFIVDENKYFISLKEYLSLDRETPANDKVKIVAKAYKTVKTVTGTRYNKYTKEMEDIIDYKEVAESSYDKSFVVDMVNGNGSYQLMNYKEDKNCYYRFYAYLVTDTGKEMALNYNGQIYAYSYKTIDSVTQYEEVEYVSPIIVPELTYTLVYERNEKLKVGDEVYFYLQDDQGRRLNDYTKFDFYTLVVSAAGNQIYQNHGERPHFTYTKEMGANVSTYTILYDSLKTYSPSSNNRIYYSKMIMIDDYIWRPTSEIRLCDEELALDIEVTFDKEVYAPKEEMEVTIKVTDHGQGVKAGVNLSALDTAYIDANGEVSSNIINSLMNSYYIGSATNGAKIYTKSASSPTFATNDMVMESAQMERGIDEESASVRDDLRVTAFFENIVTDENGVAKIKIALPDNITEWTIKAHAISNTYHAQAVEKNVKVSKDFFVNMNHRDRYLVGEHFAFNIKSFSKTSSGKDVTLKVQILDEAGNVIEENNLNGKVNDVLSYQVSNPITKTGTYQLKVTGTCGNQQDILIDEIEIADSLLDATIREELALKIGDSISIVSPKGYVYILNTDIAKILPTLFELSYQYHTNRNDTSLIAGEANRIFNNLINGVEFEYADKTSYDAEKKIFKVTSQGSDDARLALRMLATKVYRMSSQEVADKIEVRLGEEAALWAKVNMKMATLTELRKAKESILANSSKYTKEAVLYVALAFADMGAYDDAETLYHIVNNQISEKDEIEYELKVILAIKLNLKEMESLYEAYQKKDLLPENSDFVKLYYIQNAVSRNYQKGTVALKVNGKLEEIEVKNIGLTRKLIAKKDLIEVVAMSDNLEFMIEQYKPVDFSTIPNGKYIISKTYSKKNTEVGEIVEVTITINNKKLYEDGQKYGMKLEDAIPNNMTFVEFLYGQNLNGYLRKQDGQKLTIGLWNPYDPKYNPSQTISTIKYQVRVTNSGEQYEPGTILLRYTDEIMDGLKNK